MLQTIVLALVQSATEFLPVSSSGHLILIPRFLHWDDQGMVMDIALHVGTLFSVLIYFRKDVKTLLFGGINILKRRTDNSETLFVLKLAAACLPVFLVGFFAHSYISAYFRNPRLIAVTAIVFGILLYWADKKGKSGKTVETMGFKEAFIIGTAQVLALIPGVSRSGITMTAARFLNVSREEAARFSMLLSIPTIGAAGGFEMLKLMMNPVAPNVQFSFIALGMLVSFAGGVAAIGFLMHWLKTSSFAVFAIYRILLGVVLFYLF